MIIYKITSPSGKIYIGKTSRSAKVRWREHIRRARSDSKFPLCQAIRKYGPNSFKTEELLSVLNPSDVDFYEIYFIIHHKSMLPEIGYNCTYGGEGILHTEQSKQKISLAKKGVPGLPHSFEWKEKMSRVMSGRTRSEEHCNNLRLSQQGEKGHTHKLTEQDVLAIRENYVPWKYSRQRLADKYGVTRSTIQNIIERTTWRYL